MKDYWQSRKTGPGEVHSIPGSSVILFKRTYVIEHWEDEILVCKQPRYPALYCKVIATFRVKKQTFNL